MGPAGAGPATGRGAGFCMGYDVPGYMNRGYGLGFGRGFGFGRGIGGRFGGRGPGFRRGYFGGGPMYPPPPATASETVEGLKRHAQMLREELDSINDRISELENKGEDE
jgi:hypothetical protein